MSDESDIRRMLIDWATAVHTGDLATVVADHADDIVMFDVPPPFRGVRGIDAYRDTWPPFFEWQDSGAVFEVESLDVVADGEVAFAFGLLRCGGPADFAREPDQRLRLTVGLRQKGGRWTVVHEHHSFSDTGE
jgi:ketosteroid isomerase-like protein